MLPRRQASGVQREGRGLGDGHMAWTSARRTLQADALLALKTGIGKVAEPVTPAVRPWHRPGILFQGNGEPQKLPCQGAARSEFPF